MTSRAHSVLTGTDLHEPKGVATATSGQIYVADGAGSGTWSSLGSATWADLGVSSVYPFNVDASIRVASNGAARQYYVIYSGGGNGLWLYSPVRNRFEFTRINGAGQTVDITNCSRDGTSGHSLLPGALYYIYAHAAETAGGDLRIDHSTVAPSTGDPFGATNVTGWHFKNDGTLNFRLIGALKTNAAGDLWYAGTRGVYFTGFSSYYQRQHLNYHTKISDGNSSTTWSEINSNQYLSAFMWDDGAEPFCTLSGSVQSNTAGATVSVGVCIDGATTPFDYVDVYCASANVPYPFCVTVTCGDQGTDLHTYRVFMKNSSGAGSITGNRSATPATGATFSLKLEQ